jgi:hypothetical protein
LKTLKRRMGGRANIDLLKGQTDASGLINRAETATGPIFGARSQCRRLARDDEQLTRVAEALIAVAAIATLLRRR